MFSPLLHKTAWLHPSAFSCHKICEKPTQNNEEKKVSRFRFHDFTGIVCAQKVCDGMRPVVGPLTFKFTTITPSIHANLNGCNVSAVSVVTHWISPGPNPLIRFSNNLT